MKWLFLTLIIFTSQVNADGNNGYSSLSAYPEENPTTSCNQSLATDDRFALISNKLPLTGMNNITFEMLSNEAYPTSDERKGISDYMNSNQKCFTLGTEYRQRNFSPQIDAITTEFQNNMTSIAVDLYNSKITYGEANKRLQKIYDESRGKIAEITQRIKDKRDADAKEQNDEQRRQQQDQEAQNARDLAIRRQAILNTIKPIQLQPYQIPIRPTINTNCSRIGNQLNCTSQ